MCKRFRSGRFSAASRKAADESSDKSKSRSATLHSADDRKLFIVALDAVESWPMAFIPREVNAGNGMTDSFTQARTAVQSGLMKSHCPWKGRTIAATGNARQ